MEELTVGQIAAVASEVQRRVGLLNLFKERVLDDRTYEIRGDGSIHRLLERAMWIVDEHYWLMFSNSQLRTIVSNQLVKEDKKREKERPDFVAILVGQKKSEELAGHLNVVGNRLRVRTFTDLIGDTERRYKDYLATLETQTAA